MTTDRIKFLKTRIVELKVELHDAESQLYNELCAASGVRAGDVVMAYLNTRGKGMWCELRVEKVQFVGETAWVSGNTKTKSGAWSKTVRNAYGKWKRQGEEAEIKGSSVITAKPAVKNESILAATAKAG